jgi:hypothetical protein
VQRFKDVWTVALQLTVPRAEVKEKTISLSAITENISNHETASEMSKNGLSSDRKHFILMVSVNTWFTEPSTLQSRVIT